MSRRMVAPGRWEVEEPATPAHHRRTYSGIPVTTGSAMQPALTSGGNFLPGREAWKLPALTVHASPVCGEALRYDETCGRRPGHASTHRSRTLMDQDARSRRTNWRIVG